ncbi:MAG TPA: VOC family protein [Candidatus Limnocylindria bacterium]|nr:VOC family protein [Candidatus Limnocylindria bacterium]
MLRGIDHLVIAVPDLDVAQAELTESVGLACSAGGRHPDAGTSNRIAFLGEAYLELLAVDDQRLAGERPIGAAALRALEAGGGLATYALVDDALEVTAAELRANGSSIAEPVRGSRSRPDGEAVEWWTATFERLGPDAPPFVIRHANVGAEWSTEALAQRRAQRHPIGSPVELVRLDIATSDPPGLAAEYGAQLGLEFWAVADLAVTNVGPHVIRLVPNHETDLPAAVVLAAEVEMPRSVDALGVRFYVEHAATTLERPTS